MSKTQKKRGRQPLNEADRRQHRVVVTVTRDQHALLETAAAENELTLSSWVLKTCLESIGQADGARLRRSY